MEKKNTGLIVLVIILSITVLGFGGFIVYDKLNNVDSKITECPNYECKSCDYPNTTCNKIDVAGEQMLHAKMGTVYISNDGDVYFNPSEAATLWNEKVDMRNYVKDLFGDSKTYDIKSNYFMEGHRIFNYKLNLSNVRSVTEFYFGNGGLNFTLLFLHNNGNISELSFDNDNLKLYMDVSGYTNIVSMVVNQSEGGNGAKLYDSCGNGIHYVSPRFKNN